MVSTILVPLDGSPLAERALPCATALARASKARVILLYARSPLVIADGPAFDPTDAAAGLRDAGITVEPRTHDMYRGEVSEAICEVAREQSADLIVMSTHGRGGLGRWLYGSVADQVLRQATMPVVLVSAVGDRAWSEDRPMRILVPIDGSALAEEALVPAGQVAEALRAELLLLQVVGPTYYFAAPDVPSNPPDLAEELARTQQYLESVASKQRRAGRAVEVQAEIGDPVATIARVARERDADLVAMATHGRGGLARLALGSVATGTLQRAGVPLLLTRPSAVRQPSADAPGAEAGAAWR